MYLQEILVKHFPAIPTLLLWAPRSHTFFVAVSLTIPVTS